MNVIGHGIDIVECARLQEAIDRHGRRFLQRVFTQAELDYSMDHKRSIEMLAGRFAVKEAVMKVLGTGWSRGIAWTDIEVRKQPSGKPLLDLKGTTRQIADELGIADVLISISHTPNYAVASAIGVGPDQPAAD